MLWKTCCIPCHTCSLASTSAATACATYRLDSGTPRNRWGRALLEASVPDGTSLLVATASADGQPYAQHRGGPRGLLG